MTLTELLESVEREPLAVEYRWRLSAALAESGDYDGALAHAEAGIRLDPSDHRCWTLMGGCLNWRGMFNEAKQCFNKALSIAPGMPTALWNRSWCNMASGDWMEAWCDYEYGKVNKARPNRMIRNPWQGEDLDGKLIFVWGEQGHGDQIQFARWLKPLKALGATVVLETYDTLLSLLSPLADDTWVQPADFHDPYSYDYQVSLLSLPYWLGKVTGDWSIPDGKLFDFPSDGSSDIGLCWKGSPKHPNDQNRSSKEAPSGVYKELTYGEEGFIGGEDFLATAKAIAGLERVVTVDTAIAHLAGAMGKPVDMVAPLNNEGRWGYGETSPWYSTMKIHRGHETIHAGLQNALGG